MMDHMGAGSRLFRQGVDRENREGETMQLPPRGLDKKVLLKHLAEAKGQDADWRRGRTFSLVYFADEEHSEFLQKVYGSYFYENGLSPKAFPSLLKMEREVVSMLLQLLGAPKASGGNMTSGGTESILLAVKTYRDHAQALNPRLRRPQILAPESAHPAFFKAAHYFGLDAVSVPVDSNYQADPHKMAQAITGRTIMLAASAPSFPQGVLDPIGELGALARERGLGLHVDACLGGLFLPFLSGLDRDCGPWDFRALGVSSISADLHKYGYAAKGASALLFRDPQLWRYQFHVDTRWSGGVYASSTMLGTRPGGAIAAAWAALMSQGYEGYRERVRLTLELTDKMQRGLAELGLEVLGRPLTGVFSVASRQYDLLKAAEIMAQREWWLDCLNHPPSLHLIITPNHAQSIDAFLAELAQVLKQCGTRSDTEGQRRAVLYGMTSDISPDGDPESRLLQGLLSSYQPRTGPEERGGFDYQQTSRDMLRPGDFQLAPLPEIKGETNGRAADFLKEVCQAQEIRPVASGLKLMLDPSLGTPFQAGRDGVLRLDPAYLRDRASAAFHLRHGAELVHWLGLAGEDPPLHQRAAAAVLAGRTAARFVKSRLPAEQELMRAGLPQWLNLALDRLGALECPGPEGRDSMPSLIADLLILQPVSPVPLPSELQHAWPAIERRTAQCWELAAPTEYLLTTGGDARLNLDNATGLNNYGCSPRPRPWAVTFASSTASSISGLAFGHAERVRLELSRAAWGGTLDQGFGQTMGEIRAEVSALWAGARGCRVVLTNSGTDAEAIALHFALCAGGQPLVNILPASDETGGGVRQAAQGRVYGTRDLDGNLLQEGLPLAGLAANRVSLQTLAARSSGAAMISGRWADAQVEEAAARAIESGARVLLHVMDASKTGISTPSLACLDRLQARYGAGLDVVVDACQLRLSREHMAEYLRRGCMVIITGSKFYTGPPFAGALILPDKYLGRLEGRGALPPGLGRFSSRLEWPRAWSQAASSLPPRRNLGLVLRWTAALWGDAGFSGRVPGGPLQHTILFWLGGAERHPAQSRSQAGLLPGSPPPGGARSGGLGPPAHHIHLCPHAPPGLKRPAPLDPRGGVQGLPLAQPGYGGLFGSRSRAGRDRAGGQTIPPWPAGGDAGPRG
jgi:sphinganine-1-phosphate aldolase